MKVSIIAHTPDIENVLASAGRLCYSKVGVNDLLEKHSKKDNERFVNMLASMGHESPLEHVSFTFAAEGISRACSHQLVRHRIASYSQQSQRYVKLEQFEYIIPPEIEAIPEAKEIFIISMEEDQKTYDVLVDILFDKYYKKLLIKGKSEKEARREAEKKAIEDARYVFPNACETKLVFTMNVRTLLHFFEKRCCTRAQWEIRDLANEMLRQCREISPILFSKAGPSCKKGKCPEGDMSCKK